MSHVLIAAESVEVVAVHLAHSLSEQPCRLPGLSHIVVHIDDVVARLIAMGILSDESGDIGRCLSSHVAGDEEERVELGDESFFGAEEFHQSMHIVRHEPGILPCVALGVVVLTVYGAEGVERLAELSVGAQSAHKSSFLVEVVPVGLAAVEEILVVGLLAQFFGHLRHTGVG